MGLGEEDHDIILLLLVASGITIILSILPKSRWWLVWVKLWLHRRSTKAITTLYPNYNCKATMIIENIFL